MGKATISGGGTGGQYSATVRYRRDTIAAQISELETRADFYRGTIDDLEDGREKNMIKAQLLGVEKRIEWLEAKTPPEDTPISVWCADLTEDLSGDVGLAEVPGQTQFFNIVPGYDGAATYDIDKHGFIMPTVGLTSAQAYANLGLLPAWQKWKPTFRYGTITFINENVCSVALHPAYSTQQNLDVNQGTSLSNVPISYMDCDGQAFTEGDVVLVKFNDQKFTQPQVVGFRDNPQPCGGGFMVFRVYDTTYGIDEYMVFDLVADALADKIPKDDAGGLVTFPATPEDMAYWLGKTVEVEKGWSLAGGHRKKESLTRISTPINGDQDISEVLPCAGENYTNARSGTYTYSSVGNRTWTTNYSYDINNAMCFINTYAMTSKIGMDTGEYSDTYTATTCDINNSANISREYSFFTPATKVSLFSEFSDYQEGTSWDRSTGSWVRIPGACYFEAERMRTPTPHMYTSNMQTDEFYIIIGYTSFGIFEQMIVPGAECSSFCNGGGGGLPYTTENKPWRDAIIVDTAFNPEGLGDDFDPANASGTNVGSLLEAYLIEVYGRYRTNGFPLLDTNGPAWDISQEISMRENK